MTRTWSAALLLLASLTAASAQAPSPGGPFTLVAPDGSAVTDASYRGRWLLVYFGYTFCPDACPTALNEIAGALAALGPKAGAVQPLFITIDPHRDTREVMAKYVAAFDARIVGLTGTPAQTAAAARAYHVFYERQDSETGSAYLYDHSSLLYVMDPAGHFVASLPGDTAGDEIARKLVALIGDRGNRK